MRVSLILIFWLSFLCVSCVKVDDNRRKASSKDNTAMDSGATAWKKDRLILGELRGKSFATHLAMNWLDEHGAPHYSKELKFKFISNKRSFENIEAGLPDVPLPKEDQENNTKHEKELDEVGEKYIKWLQSLDKKEYRRLTEDYALWRVTMMN